ncbi:aldehyde dehydrogenase family protein [Nocardia heshunensis]
MSQHEPIQRGLLVGGHETAAASGAVTTDIDPYTSDVFATIAAGRAADATTAIDAAQAAFPAWSATPGAERRAILARAAKLLQDKTDEFTAILRGEAGATTTWGHNNILGAVRTLNAAIDVVAGLEMPQLPDTGGEWSVQIREPAGVVAAIVPWNAPLVLCVRAVTVALAVGNTVVIRPSEDAPISSGLFLADVLTEAGLPPGVLNVVTNDRADAPEVIETLIADPRVRRVGFTGSTPVGRIVGEIAGRNLTPVVLELGGKNPIIVLDDADLDLAVDHILYTRFMNSGQICLSVDRIILHADIAAAFTTKFVARAAQLPHGDPNDPATIVGPLVNQRATDRVHDLLRDAIDHGAQVLLGGDSSDPAVIAPTVLTGITPAMRIFSEEIFGPVACLYTVATDDEALALANSTEYGLTSALFSNNPTRATALARGLRHASTHINNHTLSEDPVLPAHSIGDSGFGSHWDPLFFTQPRSIYSTETPAALPF